ncbi:MAG: ABC transporter permease [Synergistaceae bacterium]|jgi:cell division transport system permease protein|nr:ABC transporter permease [Synergistaceae bacterium]
MTAFRYILRDTGRLLMRHWVLGALTLVTAAVMMWILGLTTLFSLNIQNMLRRLENELMVQVYVKADGNAEQVAAAVRKIPSVASMQLISPEDALSKLQLRMGSQARVLDIVGENPLPWSVEVRVKNAASVPGLVRDLMAMSEVDDVVYSGLAVERVSTLSRVAFKTAFAMFILSIMITSLVLYNTIHISLYSRREEIGIMFLIGATRGYISTPFVLEGTALAFLGSVIATVGIMSAYFPGIRLLQNSLPFLNFVGDAVVLRQFSLLLVGFGATLGWICSYIAVVRFMRAAMKPL